jgi:hypothetical protein
LSCEVAKKVVRGHGLKRRRKQRDFLEEIGISFELLMITLNREYLDPT